jgi:hypothetical protein
MPKDKDKEPEKNQTNPSESRRTNRLLSGLALKSHIHGLDDDLEDQVTIEEIIGRSFSND